MLVRSALIPAALLALCTTACQWTRAHEFARSQLIGTYEAHYDFGTETLVLRDDGSYQQRFVDRSGHAFSTEGKWTFRGGNHGQVWLNDPMPILDAFGHFGSSTPQRIVQILDLALYHGHIVIDRNPDLPLLMYKTA